VVVVTEKVVVLLCLLFHHLTVLLVSVLLLAKIGGVAAAALLALSPLSWLEAGGGAHLELFMLPLLLLWAWARRRAGNRTGGASWPAIAGTAAALAIAIKATAGTVLIAAGAVDLREGKRRFVAITLGVATLIVVAAYLLVWAPPHPFGGLIAESTKSMRTPIHLLRMASRTWLAADAPMAVLRPATLLLLLAWVAWRSRTVRPGLALAVEAWLFATCFVLGVLQPWHAIPLLGLALLLDDTMRVRQACMVLATTAPLFTYGGWLAMRPQALRTGAFPYTAVVFITLGILLPVCFTWWRRDQGRTA
jgi:hypothetical protein